MYNVLREWRNWQTRTFEGRVVLPYGFNSRLPHQKIPSGFMPLGIFLRVSRSLNLPAIHTRVIISNGAVTFGETEKSQEDNKNQQNIK